MSRDNQFNEDVGRLASLIERHTGIPGSKVSAVIREYGADQIMGCANILCVTNIQRQKLASLFDFKNTYELLKLSGNNKEYILNSTDVAIKYLCNYYADVKDKEHFAAVFTNSQYKVIAAKTMSSGSVDTATVNVREIIKEALFCNATSVIVSHNHPGGSAKASMEDIEVTARIQVALGGVGVMLADHIIVAGDSAVSMADMGYLTGNHVQSSVQKAASPLSEKPGAYAPNAKPSVRGQLKAAKAQRISGAKQAAPHRGNANRSPR